jgi:hypothetical protein
VTDTTIATALARTEAVAPSRADWPTIPGRLPLTEDAVRHIAEIDDVAVRNLWITQSYADLAQRLLSVLETDQTWCTFAIWASNTAGLSIRGEELPKLVSELLLGADEHVDAIVRGTNARTSTLRRLGLLGELQRSHLEHLVAQAVAQVSAFIANGNTLVYGELAPLFVRFVDSLCCDGAPAPDRVDATLDRLGIPTDTQAPKVRLAFQQYALAAAATESTQRAQHVLAANVAAVLHEQERLQTDIVSALDAGLIDVGDDLCGIVHGRVANALLRPVVAEVHEHVAPHLERLWQHVATRMLMTLSVPGETLRLERDVPPVPGTGHLFPVALQEIDLPVLRALLNEWDRTGGTGRGSGAGDWADLHQRMGYIVNLFRSRQQHLALTVPPFTADQLMWMAVGDVAPSL